jgi:hypothetical protein
MSLASIHEDYHDPDKWLYNNCNDEGEEEPDPVNHPQHYTGHPSGIEAITVTQFFNFCMGNAIKYIWRADSKGKPIEDLEKARWYIEQEIKRRKSLVK